MPLNKSQILLKREMLERELAALPVVKCANCTSWASGWCQYFDSNPPPEVVEVGCDEFDWDGVPF